MPIRQTLENKKANVRHACMIELYLRMYMRLDVVTGHYYAYLEDVDV